MSWMSEHGHAQYNYYPDRTRPGGPLETRSPDPKRPQHPEARPSTKPSTKRSRTR